MTSLRVVAVHRLDRDEARRIAVRAQLLDATRLTDLVTVVEQLGFLRIDPTAAVAPNADLVAWTRLGPTYSPADLTHELEVERTLFELRGHIRVMPDVAFTVPEELHPSRMEWVEANDGFRRDVLARLDAEGPLPAGEIPDTHQVPWGSSGWTNDRNVNQLLELMSAQGDVAVSARRGRLRVWDLAERVYDDVERLTPDEAATQRAQRRVRSLGIVRPRSLEAGGEAVSVGAAGEAAVVDGVDGEWRVDPAELDQPFEGRTALLSPFDRMVADRDRLLDLFDFEYVLEMYKPAAQRRWGFFALPVLHHDRLVGKLDAKADRKKGTFTVHAVHEDAPFTTAVRDDVDAEIEALADLLGLELIRPR
ncbi:MAG: hypothetical protein JWO46_1546 [Nocardioidaceae bacterium]|nr:hypothetical protein [Nocardioidaceae bacterium]